MAYMRDDPRKPWGGGGAKRAGEGTEPIQNAFMSRWGSWGLSPPGTVQGTAWWSHLKGESWGISPTKCCRPE